MRSGMKLVCGVGVNDTTGQVDKYELVGGKRVRVWRCPFYQKWNGMLRRCYDINELKRYPTYIDCFVCDEWLFFSNFKAWMGAKDWEGKCLDKDIINPGNKIYSPENCAFVDASLNNFLTLRKTAVGPFPAGVHFSKLVGKYRAQCSNPFNKKYEPLGFFNNPEDAHLAWKRKKQEHAKRLADMQDDPRVANSLRMMFT